MILCGRVLKSQIKTETAALHAKTKTTIEELSDELTDVKVGKINIDEEFELSQKFKVMSIPTTIVIENGEVKNKAVGVQTKAEVLQML